VLDYAL
jgi:hypothetical protein